jgi:predicted SnoaL-like aldol condensation-catalyzing enzyme
MKTMFLATAMLALTVGAGSARADSPAHGLTTKPEGIAAVEFLDLAINQKKVDEALAKYAAAPYTQHDLMIPDGIEGARTGIAGFLKQAPGFHLDFKRVIVGDNYVLVHSLASGLDKGGTVVDDIFRVENGKLVEHWDVFQAVTTSTINHNTQY